MTALDLLCHLFVSTDRDAAGWAFEYPDEEGWESPDCDVMSARFLTHARQHGVDGFLVRAESIDEGQHWFTVITDPDTGALRAVDWTARQFHNAGHPAPPTDPYLIECPLIFDWEPEAPTYPLEVVQFQKMVPTEGMPA